MPAYPAGAQGGGSPAETRCAVCGRAGAARKLPRGSGWLAKTGGIGDDPAGARTPPAPPMPNSPLFRRYWIATSLLVTALLVAYGAVQAWFEWNEGVRRISSRQQSEARAAARELEITLAFLEAQLSEVAQLPWEAGVLTDADRQQEFHRLQKLIPAVSELRAIDGSGRERVAVSRTEPDRIGGSATAGTDPLLAAAGRAPVHYGPTQFRGDVDPFVRLIVRERPGAPAATVAEIDLRHVARLVARMRVGVSGHAYLVDARGHVIAHPDMSRTLAHRDVSASPEVAGVRAALRSAAPGEPVSISARNLDGDDVRATGLQLAQPPWLVMVEEPLGEALTPVRRALERTAVLLLVGLAAAFVVSLALARTLTRPILRLREGAARLGHGDLDARVAVDSADEVGDVAREFNRMAARLQESHASLEDKVRVRTSELSQARDRLEAQAGEVRALNDALTRRAAEAARSRDEAERASAAKTRFLASASHDLRQPMHAIALLVGVLRERAGDPQTRAVVARIEQSVEAMENLFRSLLDISKLDAGAVRPNVGEVAVATLLAGIVASYGELARAKGLTLRAVPSRAVVASDAALLERILGNLVANAINYTSRGGVVIGARRRGNALRLLVVDTGPGIPPAHRDDIFEEFFQLQNPGHDRSKGLGLGLSIVRRSADLLGHALIVRSAEGRGSTFGVEVPLAPSRRTAPPPPSGADGGAVLHGAFVAVVDDDADARAATATLCREWGCIVVSADSPGALSAALEGHLRAPDLVITDYRLAGGATGLSVVAAVRQAAERAVPAIVLTGDVAVAADDAFDALGATLLHKPLNARQLRRTAVRLLTAAA